MRSHGFPENPFIVVQYIYPYIQIPAKVYSALPWLVFSFFSAPSWSEADSTGAQLVRKRSITSF
jgi:hypothetical protein